MKVANPRTWLWEARKRKGLTQEQAAAGLGISFAYYSLIETGRRMTRMSLPFAIRLSKLLDIPLQEIIDREGVV